MKWILVISLVFLTSVVYADPAPIEGGNPRYDYIFEDRYVEDTDTDTRIDNKNNDDAILGLKADAPNLINLTNNSSIGLEASKDLNRTSAKEGWAAYLKYTWEGSLLDFSGE